jgi:bifunctional non-homologous end joining protein LigD
MQPMLAVLADAPLSDPDLVYEPKYDGIRALITVTPIDPGDPGRGPRLSRDGLRQAKHRSVHAIAGRRYAHVAITSRVGNDKTAQFPELVHALSRWGARRAGVALLDGEIVALDADGQPAGFQRIQDRIHLTAAREIVARAAAAPVAFVAFDLLRDGDDDLCALPLLERRRRLEAALALLPGDAVRLSKQVRGDGTALLAEVRAHGWEGLVVKDARSPYRPGRRSREWRKLKLVQRDSFVVGGFTEPRGARARFGALLLGVRQPDGRLRFAGHVGGGFSDPELDRVARLLVPLETPTCPFGRRPVTNETPHWTRPVLVAEVRFLGTTDDGVLRAPIYLGLRDDVLTGPSKGLGPRAMSSARRSRASLDALRPPVAIPAAAADGRPPSRAALARVRDQLEALLERGGGRLQLPDGVALPVTNLAKPLWPKLGLTKADLLRHYLDVAPLILPIVRDRPLVMRRFPDGVDGHSFFQHRAPDEVPAGVRALAIPGDDVAVRLVGGELTTLLHMAQLAVISQDPWFSRAQSPRDVDFVAIDLDPMDGAPLSRVRDVARWVHDELELLGVAGHLKTSGARGLHIYLPMQPGTSFEAGLLFCRLVASVVAGRHPDAATVERGLKRRAPSAVYLDCLQNGFGKTLACAYSARASAFAGVSTPLTWKELDRPIDPRDFTIRTLAGRLRDVGDLWSRLRKAKGIDLDATLERARSKHGPT